MTKISTHSKTRVRQGDIYKDVECIEYAIERAGVFEVSRIFFPNVIVLTQDCDLEQEYAQRWARKRRKENQDKWLISILVAPLYNAEHLFQGSHLSELELGMREIQGSEQNRIKTNQIARYHYLEFPDNVSLVPMVIDFKHYFSVNSYYLKVNKKTNFVCSVSPIYREDVSLRFANFLARIGLPK